MIDYLLSPMKQAINKIGGDVKSTGIRPLYARLQRGKITHSITARQICRLIVLSASSAFLYASSNAWASDPDKQSYSQELVQCCLQGKAYEKSGGVFKFAEPIDLFFVNLADLSPGAINPSLSIFYNSIINISHLQIVNEGKFDPHREYSAALIFVAVPKDGSDFTPDRRFFLERMLTAAFSHQGDVHIDQDYVDAAVKAIYASPEGSVGKMVLYSAIRNGVISRRTIAAVIARMPSDPGEQIFNIETGTLQALGYNPDNVHIDDSIFSGHNPIATDKDYTILGEIYRNKHDLVLRK